MEMWIAIATSRKETTGTTAGVAEAAHTVKR